MSEMSRAPGQRIRALDGLRGLAASVVLIHHALLASAPKLAVLYGPHHASQVPLRGSLNWLVFYTPLHIFWAGPEFVAVFFVLSGFVLALPVVKSGRVRLASYYPSRLLRLYLPVWVALGFAVLMHVVVSHAAIPGASRWLNSHSDALSWKGLLQNLTLGPQTGSWALNTALWTMYWIVLFAVLFPLVSLIPFSWRIVRWGVALACFASLLYGTSPFSLEMPPFVLGVVLAFEQEGIRRLAERWNERSGTNVLLKTLMGLVCICLLTADRWDVYTRATLTAVVLGACLSVICAVVLVSWRKFFESPPMQWIGKRAFSLYLVHEPLVVVLAFAVGTSMAPGLFVLLAMAASISVCAVFFALVESPSHSLARDAGEWFSAWCSRSRQRLAGALRGA